MLEYPFLRSKLLLFPKFPVAYYLCLLVNTGIRFSWLFKAYHLESSSTTDDKTSTGVWDAAWYVFGLQVLEVFRRWLWTFIRIENHYLALGFRHHE